MDSTILTEFNSNAATLQRVDTILRLCSDYSVKGDIHNWFKWLCNAKKEAIIKVPSDDRKEWDEKFERVKSMVRNPNTVKLNAYKVIDELEELEIFVRQFMNDKGMLLRDGQSAMDRFQSGGM